MIELTGVLRCKDAEEAEIVTRLLPEHIRLTHEEPGCMLFEVKPDGPLNWRVMEAFVNKEAFEAHQLRTRASAWWQQTKGITREFEIREL